MVAGNLEQLGSLGAAIDAAGLTEDDVDLTDPDFRAEVAAASEVYMKAFARDAADWARALR